MKKQLVQLNKPYGIGFICNLKIPKKLEKLTTLITTNKILGRNDIELGSNIVIYFNFNKNSYDIVIDNSRITYIDEDNNLTIIEIKKEDGIIINNLLEINANKSEEDIIKKKKIQTIYLMNYYYDTEIRIYKSKIINIEKKKDFFFFK